MGAGAYLQAAASQLQQAAMAVKAEADQLRTDLNNFERQASREIDSKDADSRTHAAEATAAEDPRERAQLERIAINLKNEKESKKHELDQMRSEYTQRIKEKEAKANDLKGKAGEMQTEASSLG